MFIEFAGRVQSAGLLLMLGMPLFIKTKLPIIFAGQGCRVTVYFLVVYVP